MFFQGGGEILGPWESTIQGDNLAMSFYALGTSIILERLKLTSPTASQISLADDITGTGKILDLRIHWDAIISEGKKLPMNQKAMPMNQKAASSFKVQVTSIMQIIFSKTLVLNLLVKESAT